MAETEKARPTVTRQPTDEEEPLYPSRDSLGRSSTPIVVPNMTDPQRNTLLLPPPMTSTGLARDATTPVVLSPHGPEKLVPRAPTLVTTVDDQGLPVGKPRGDETAVEPAAGEAKRSLARDRRLTRSVRLAQKEASRYRQSKKLWAVVVGDFQGIYGDELTLKAGERVEIVSKDVRVSRNIGWWTGRNEKGRYGIFPEGCVKILTKEEENDDEVNIEIEYPFIISCSDIQLKEPIGVGGFGRVHRAIYKEQEVAVKVAKSTTFDLVKAAQDVITEAKKFAHLAHVNVCALIGVVLVRDVCLVMEYAQGGALSDVLHKRKLTLPLDVILDWSYQIASGMNYLHTEVKPSLLHRDLKSSNILLANPITPSNLYNNTVKITDFGLAREIEHTTQMTGAGTYPWMAPEVIISNDFSTKCDVWSFGVVMWELLTGEKPYGNLNAFVVAYGVGRGTLSLPIPEGCPESFQELMNVCWRKEYSKRPPFTEVLWRLKDIEHEEFVTSTSLDDFLSIQSTWKSEIQEKFLKFKREESAFKEQELPRDIANRIKLQEEKIQQQQAELEKLRKDTKEAQEVWQMKREKEQAELFQRQREELERLKEKLKEIEIKSSDNPAEQQQQQQNRPPRVKRFSARRLLKWLSGADNQKNQPKPQQRQRLGAATTASAVHPSLKHTTSATTVPTHQPNIPPPRRTTSFPSSFDPLKMSETRRPASVAEDIHVPSHIHGNANKRTSLPRKIGPTERVAGSGHKRRHSGGNITRSQIEGYGLDQDSSPVPIPGFSTELGAHIRPFTEGMQKMINKETSPTARLRSLSHPRSPSPHLLPFGVSSPNSPKSPQLSSTNSAAYSQSASVASEFGSIKKPSNLTLQNKHVSSDDSNPNSPMNNPCVYDSGKDSATGSDFSNLSVLSAEQQSHHLISFESPGRSKAAMQMAALAFDPLLQVSADETVQQLPLRQTPSYDSLLMEQGGGTTSGNVSPCVYATYPNLRRQTSPRSSTNERTSPRSSLTTEQQQLLVRNSPIARPRPRPGRLNAYCSDTGPIVHPHRPLSPQQHHHTHRYSRSDVSPSGSVQSLFVGSSMTGYDSDYGIQSDSDVTSTHSSLMDLPNFDECAYDLQLQPPLMPTPASLDTIHFEFDVQKFQ